MVDHDNWEDAVYLYSSYYKDFLQQEIERIAQQETISPEDFHKFDLIRPAGLSGLESFLNVAQLNESSKVLEVGSGLGGNFRFLTQRTGCKVFGVEYLQHFVDLSNRISQLCGMSDKHECYQGDATNFEYPQSEFDAALDIGVYFNFPGDGIFQMLYNALKPGGYFYFEDYVMANEYPEQMEPEYKEIFTKKFPMVSVKTESDLIALLQRVGFVIELHEDFTSFWSERTWENAEALHQRMRDNPDTQDRILLSKFECYGKFTPTILNDVGHYSAEELRNKFPLLCSSFDFEHCVWHTERKAKVLKLIARKPIDN